MKTRVDAIPMLALMCVTAIWGSTFFIIKGILTSIPTLDFLGVRFFIAGLVIIVLRGRKLLRASVTTWERGLMAGVVFAVAQIVQTIGLETADASVSGFITGMYVILTPLLLFIAFRTPISKPVAFALVLAFTGLSILSLNGFSVGRGEGLTFISAVLFAVHIVLLDQWAGQESGLDLAAIQLIALGVICGVSALPGGVVLPSGINGWAVMIYMALIAGIVTVGLQTWAQSRIPATSAAVIMTTEPVFAAIFAILFGGEHVTWRLFAGGSLVVGAMLLAELAPRKSLTADGGVAVWEDSDSVS